MAARSRSAGVRRLMQEAQELQEDQDPSYTAAPLEDDIFAWHFTIRGPGGDFQDGIYHGRMLLPPTYPFAPPEIYLLTPSGRFETNKKICLSISSFHPESWQPSWGIRTALVALMAFFASEPKGAVGSLDAPPEERRRLAKLSHDYRCPTCGFDSSSPFAQSLDPDAPLSIVVPPREDSSSPEPETIAPVSRETHSEPPTATIFPSPRSGMPPQTPTMGRPDGGMGVGAGLGAVGGVEVAGELDGVVLPALRPVERQPAPVGRMVVVAGPGLNGGSPLLVDRCILVILVAILALVVNKFA